VVEDLVVSTDELVGIFVWKSRSMLEHSRDGVIIDLVIEYLKNFSPATCSSRLSQRHPDFCAEMLYSASPPYAINQIENAANIRNPSLGYHRKMWPQPQQT